MKVLVFDPSGNFGEKEGAGTTGWALFRNGELMDFGAIKSTDYDTQEAYWDAHWNLIVDEFEPEFAIGDNHLLIETYRLQAHKALQQSGSTLDTPQLLGYLRMKCWDFKHPQLHWQNPQDKVRVADEILVKQGYLEKKNGRYYCLNRSTVIHMRDAIRHGIFFHKYGKGRKLLDVYNNSKRTFAKRD